MSDEVMHNCRVPPEIKERLGKLAEVTKRSQTVLTVEALKRYLDDQEWQVAEIKAAVEEADRTPPEDWIPHEEVMSRVFSKHVKKSKSRRKVATR